MKTKFWMGLAVSFVSVCMLMPTTAFAQAVYGSILGTVTDPQGAAVAGAKVTVTNQRKGTEDTTTTNADGNYSVTHLVPDTYTVKIEAPGFKVSQQKDVLVQADAGARVDLQFQVGGTTETVEVTAEAPQLKTDRADVAVSFNEKYVEDVPILNRNFTQIQLLAPGSQKIVWMEPRSNGESARRPANLHAGPALQRHRLRTGRHRQPGPDPGNHRRESQPRRCDRSQGRAAELRRRVRQSRG